MREKYMSNPNKGIFVVLFGPGLEEEALSSKELVPSAALHTQVMKSNYSQDGTLNRCPKSNSVGIVILDGDTNNVCRGDSTRSRQTDGSL
jgi:hypothetical protein